MSLGGALGRRARVHPVRASRMGPHARWARRLSKKVCGHSGLAVGAPHTQEARALRRHFTRTSCARIGSPRACLALSGPFDMMPDPMNGSLYDWCGSSLTVWRGPCAWASTEANGTSLGPGVATGSVLATGCASPCAPWQCSVSRCSAWLCGWDVAGTCCSLVCLAVRLGCGRDVACDAPNAAQTQSYTRQQPTATHPHYLPALAAPQPAAWCALSCPTAHLLGWAPPRRLATARTRSLRLGTSRWLCTAASAAWAVLQRCCWMLPALALTGALCRPPPSRRRRTSGPSSRRPRAWRSRAGTATAWRRDLS